MYTFHQCSEIYNQTLQLKTTLAYMAGCWRIYFWACYCPVPRSLQGALDWGPLDPRTLAQNEGCCPYVFLPLCQKVPSILSVYEKTASFNDLYSRLDLKETFLKIYVDIPSLNSLINRYSHDIHIDIIDIDI